MVNDAIGQQRMLVIVALAWNALLAASWIMGGGTDGAIIAAIVAGPPIVLLALFRHPRALSFAAAALGLIYALLIVTAFSAFALVFAPTALCLLSTALLPWLNSEPAVRRRRRLGVFGAIIATVLILAVALVLLAL
jgi:hypothetical protein